MAFLPYQCPHCQLDRVSLDVVGSRLVKQDAVAVYVQCPACRMPSSAVLTETTPGYSAASAVVQGNRTNLLVDNKLIVSAMFPGPQISEAPNFVPDPVARVFIQATDAMRKHHYDLASMGYRKTLDIGLKAFDPTIKGDFRPRIDKLAERHDLTPAMRDWAHEVRLLGNEGAHELDEPTAEDVADLAALTQSTLEYLFTMPKRVEDRRAKREADKAAAKAAAGTT